MRYSKPYFYDDFKCIADRCPDTCCAGWQIVIDEDSLERYSVRDTAVECDFERRLERAIDWREGCFHQHNGRCAMLNEENLCDLVIARGEEWLCDTCRRYPRHIEEFEGLRELSLSLSCPVAAELILKEENRLRFITWQDDEEDPLEEEFEDFDILLFTQLEDAREVLFQIVQNRELSIERRMELALSMARKLQTCVDEERFYDMDAVIASYGQSAVLEKVPEVGIFSYGTERFERLKDDYNIFYRLERLREDWTEVLAEVRQILYAGDCAKYLQIYEAFVRDISVEQTRWDCFREQLLMFFLYTYFCGAVYDDCIYSKVALAVFSVTYLQEFIMCRCYLKPEDTTAQEWIKLAYAYAREIEHSDDNLNMLEEWLMETM